MKNRLNNVPEIILVNLAKDIIENSDIDFQYKTLDRDSAYEIIEQYRRAENIPMNEYYSCVFTQFEIDPGQPNFDV
jgi:endonuclease V-like protein UPF0215 family